MEEIVSTVAENRILAVIVVLALLLIVFYVVKSAVKIGLVILIVVIAVGGYLYFKNPENRFANVTDAMNKAKTATSEVVEKGKSVYNESRKLMQKGTDTYKKGKEKMDSGRQSLERGVKTGKEMVRKGKEWITDLFLFLKEKFDSESKSQRKVKSVSKTGLDDSEKVNLHCPHRTRQYA